MKKVLAIALVVTLLMGLFIPHDVVRAVVPSGIPVLVLQSGYPWGNSEYLSTMTSLGYAPTTADWAAVGITVHLEDFRYLYIPSVQESNSFYANYTARMSEIEVWVAGGGRLLFSFCTQGASFSLPGGATQVHGSAGNNHIVDASHPIVTGVLSDGIALTDADLSGNSCSHNFLTALPASAHVILEYTGHGATLAEYDYGKGHVVASGLTWEFYLHNGSLGGTGAFALRAYDDLLLHAFGKVRNADISAPMISLPSFGSVSGTTNWVGAAVPSFTVGSSPFMLTFDLSDDSGSAKWSITVNNRVIVDPWGSGTITYAVPLAGGRNDVLVSAVDSSGNAATQKLVITLDDSGPVLTFNPALPVSTASPSLVIAGTVTDAASGIRSLSINGTPVVLFADGSFSEQVALTKGNNTIVIEAVDRVGHVASQTATVTYQAASSSVPSSLYVILTIGQKSMQVDGMPVAMDSAPVIQSGRTLLPIRALIQTLGGTTTWNGDTKTATVALGGCTVAVTIGSKTALVNGKPVALDVAAVIIGGRTFLPLRFVGENLGLGLAWEPVSQTVSFTYWP